MNLQIKAVAAAIFLKDKVLAVKRPKNPQDVLSGSWGLPAVQIGEGEDEEIGIKRIGVEKLGALVEPNKRLGELQGERALGTLTLVLWECTMQGNPNFNRRQPTNQSNTVYDKWQWKDPKDLIPAAKRGSLCSQLMLKHLNINYDSR